MKYILISLIAIVTLHVTSCSCQMTGSATADIICDPSDTFKAMGELK